MQTPGRQVEPQTPMIPLERRMDNAYERLLVNAQNAQLNESRGASIRGLGRIVLEMEQLNNNMEAMQNEIRKDIRERRKYFLEEQKILKKDLENTENFKTAAFFNLRKMIGIFGFGIAANELAQGDIGGAIQGVGLGVSAFLPEIAQGVIALLAAKGLIGGGGLMRGGMMAGGLGMLGGGRAKGILALAALGGLLLTGGALASNNRRQETITTSFDETNNTINKRDVDRFRGQLSRADSILTDIDQTKRNPFSADQVGGGVNMQAMQGLAGENTGEVEQEVEKAQSKEDPSGEIQQIEQKPEGDGGLTDAEIEAIIEANGGRNNIMPAVMSPISDEELIEARSTIIPEPNITTNTTNFVGDQIIEDLSWSPPPEKEEKLVMNEKSKDFNILTAISALEAGDDQSRADVAQSIYNRVADTGDYGDTVFDVITRDNQYQPAFEDPTSSDFQPTAKIWKDITDKKSAIAAMMSYYEKRGQSKTKDEIELLFEQTADALKNVELQAAARKHVGGNTEFLSGSSFQEGDSYRGRLGIDNTFFSAYGSGTQLERGAQPIPSSMLRLPEVEKKPSNQWWDFLDVFPNEKASLNDQGLPIIPRTEEVASATSMVNNPIIANIAGTTTTASIPQNMDENEPGGEGSAVISTTFSGSIDKLDAAYALNSYAAFS